MRRTIGRMEPNRYRRHLATMTGVLISVAYVSIILSAFDVWGALV